MKQLPIEIFMPPNMLRAKLGSGGDGIDTTALVRAEAAIAALKPEFGDWVASDVQRLSDCRERFALQPDQAAREQLYRIAHDLKGQAATFEFPIISRMAASLVKLLDGLNPAEPVATGLVDAHVTAIRAVFRDKVRSASDRMSVVVAQELEARVAEALEDAR